MCPFEGQIYWKLKTKLPPNNVFILAGLFKEEKKTLFALNLNWSRFCPHILLYFTWFSTLRENLSCNEDRLKPIKDQLCKIKTEIVLWKSTYALRSITSIYVRSRSHKEIWMSGLKIINGLALRLTRPFEELYYYSWIFLYIFLKIFRLWGNRIEKKKAWNNLWHKSFLLFLVSKIFKTLPIQSRKGYKNLA